jgi:hypothetical protein
MLLAVRWEHARDLNVPAWRKWVNRYSDGNIPDAAAYFLASAIGWALHKETGVDRDATRLQASLLDFGRLLLASG